MTRFTCENCGKEFPTRREKCSECGYERVTPDWVLVSRVVKPRFEVAVTKKRNQPEKLVIHLSKWWWAPSTMSKKDYSVDKLNINSPDEWSRIQDIINAELSPIAGWKTEEEAIAAVRLEQKSEATATEQLKQLVHQHPRLAVRLLNLLDSIEYDEESDHDFLIDLLNSIPKALNGVSKRFLVSLSELIAKLPAQGELALSELHRLLERWKLLHVTLGCG
jgi:RNA polymerase subunit RPABC4/transcription elongation factor Spt4